MIELIIGLVSAIVLMLAKIKWDGNKIDNLKEENAAHEKKDEIIDDMGLAKIKLKEKQDEALKNNSGDDWYNSI